MPAAMTTTDVAGLKLLRRGKVRDVYDLGERLLIVASDRISAFDVVLGTGIPYKGRVLTALTLFWFGKLRSASENHLVTANVAEMSGEVRAQAEALRGRTMLVRKAQVVPVECVVRGYLAGSGWKEYRERGTVCGMRLPRGLVESSRLPEPLFTPSTKAEAGHDVNISFEEACRMHGADLMTQLRDRSLAVYKEAAEHAIGRGIIICDTKFEWGLADGRLILIDEVLTPDSSRFWPSDGYQAGGSQPSFDKQPLRDWLEKESGWNKEPPGPPLPEHVVRRTSERYMDAYRKLTGQTELP